MRHAPGAAAKSDARSLRDDCKRCEPCSASSKMRQGMKKASSGKMRKSASEGSKSSRKAAAKMENFEEDVC